MLAISCESDSEEEDGKAQGTEVPKPAATTFTPDPDSEPEPEPEPKGYRWWERNDRLFSERFVKPIHVPWQSSQQPLSLLQSEGGGPDSDGQVTVWDAAIVLHRMLLCCAAVRHCCGNLEVLDRQGVIELGAGSGLV